MIEHRGWRIENKKNIKNFFCLYSILYLLSSILCFFMVDICLAVEIQLGNNGSTGNFSGNVVGYVDMEKIFNEYPETQAAMIEYQKSIAARRDEIARMEAELIDLKQKKSIMESTVNNTSPVPVSTTVAQVPAISTSATMAIMPSTATLSNMETEITQKEKAIQESRDSAAKSLSEQEERKSLIIMNKIYKTLEKLALSEGISVVVDKTTVMYGIPAVDLTDKLAKKLRGE